MLFTTTNFIAGIGICSICLSCGAPANAVAISSAGHLRDVHLDHLPASIAELGASLSETNRYIVCIWDERTAKSERVGRARRALFRCPLRERRCGPGGGEQQAQGHTPRQVSRLPWRLSVWAFRFHQESRANRNRYPASSSRHRYAPTGARACRKTSAFVPFDPPVSHRNWERTCGGGAVWSCSARAGLYQRRAAQTAK
jgi:hypothetical protein